MTVEELRRRLEARTDAPVELVLTRNRTRLASSRRRPGGELVLRVHEALVKDGDVELVETLASFVSGSADGRAALRRLARARRADLEASHAALPSRRARSTRIDAVGRVHDLDALLDETRRLALDLIAGDESVTPERRALLAEVRGSWSGTPGRARRRIRLGAWDEERRVVRIHRRLDAEDVPPFFVRAVLHHELCHALLGPPPLVRGRRVVHGPEFRRLERAWPDHERAERWERENLGALLGRPPGDPSFLSRLLERRRAAGSRRGASPRR